MPLLLNGQDDAALAEAARRWAAGELVALPTETVYGLGARADDDAAVAKIFAAKGRPSDHPLIVHVADASAAATFAAEIPPAAHKLMAAFWPGPLTVIVPRRLGVGTAAAGGQDTIGLRCPAHPVAHALLQRAAQAGVMGIAAPSANRFGRISPTRAAHVVEEFADLSDAALAVVDGGACDVGIESSIVDCSGLSQGGRAVLLRPGVLTREAIEAVIGPLGERGGHSPRASGTLEAHYAPRAKLRLMPTEALRSALAVLGPELTNAQRTGNTLAVYSRSSLSALWPEGVRHGPIAHRAMPSQPRLAAHELFAALRELDATGVPLIWVETPPDTPEWEGVRDRLQRAAAAG
ncbi:L-threonylcarbamoyladenylate synthase [Aquabacterium sp.]|uniref:L-threonylcarbamoyladenylate synthase n=1 Tax=Aquabacterium sp. TaxID=1872578 RepID=UPI0035B218A2